MTRTKHSLHGDQFDILVSHLRGEVGEVITSWTYLREFLAQINASATEDQKLEMQNPALIRLNNLRDRFEDDIVGRLSELAQQKSGRTNFFAASRAFRSLSKPVEDFRAFVKQHGLHDRRNKVISHKQLPTHWLEKDLRAYVGYKIILRGVAMALSLMKAIDSLHVGPSSRYLWFEMRKRRYTPQHPARHSYVLLPYYHLPGDIRLRVAQEEAALGNKVWESMDTIINGKKARLVVCKRWGIIKLGNRLLALDQYPLVKMNDIQLS